MCRGVCTEWKRNKSEQTVRLVCPVCFDSLFEVVKAGKSLHSNPRSNILSVPPVPSLSSLIQKRKGPEGDALNPVDFVHPTAMRRSQSIAGSKQERRSGVEANGPTHFIRNMDDRPVRTKQTTNTELRLELDGTRQAWSDDLARVVSRNNKELTMPHGVVWE